MDDLISRNKAIEWLDYRCRNVEAGTEQEDLYISMKMILDELPPEEAISVDWMKSLMQKKNRFGYKLLSDTAGVILKMWRKDREEGDE